MPTISSRTPEGLPNRCPFCDEPVCIEPSKAPGDGPCPACGHLLWFSPTTSGFERFDFELVAPFRDRVYDYISASLGINHYAVRNTTPFGARAGADSLDIVELVMEIEEKFGITIPNEETEKMHTIAHFIDYLFRQSLQS